VIVCRGGYGSTLGALRHGVPLVVMPLFSADQWVNAAAVARAGAGIALDAPVDGAVEGLDRAYATYTGVPTGARA
jgi:UDP:flavonoid glycosyltransferase YjiC (YdhE family)